MTSRLSENLGRLLGGRYLLLAGVGQGASGDVYLAQDRSLGRKVAVKVLHSSLADDLQFLKRFRAEAKSAAALNHPSIMRVFDWGESEDEPYLVLEYLSGGNLREYFATGRRLSVPQATFLGYQAASGLAYAHQRGYVHRDLKPANLLLDDEGRIRIADFGLALAMSEAAWTEPVGVLIGTAKYASPEQAKGRLATEASDVYSLGLVLYEALSGKLPFTGDTTFAILMARVEVDVEGLAEFGELRELLEAALRAEPNERISSADLVSRLDAINRKLDAPDPLIVARKAPLLPDALDMAMDDGSGTAFLPTRGVSLTPDVLRNGGTATELYDGEAVDFLRPSNDLDVDSTAMVSLEGAKSETTPKASRTKKRRWIPWVVLLAVLASMGVGGYLGGASLVDRIFKVTVPPVVGEPLAVAENRIRTDNLKPKVISLAYSSAIAAGEVVSETPRQGLKVNRSTTVRLVVSKGHAPVPVPDLAGLDQKQVEVALAKVGLVGSYTQNYSETVSAGLVIAWTPSATDVKLGATVTVTLSKGPSPRTVPGVIGDSQEVATSQLSQLGLQVAVSQAYSTTYAAGDVISQTPAAGQQVAKGSTVNLSISQGPQMVTVPNVVSDSLAEAKAALTQAGLVLGTLYGGKSSNTVVYSNPPQGSSVIYGSSVDLYLV